MDSPEQPWQVTRGRNLSLTGVSFQLAQHLPVGTELSVQMGILGNIGKRGKVSGRGKIVWIQESKVVVVQEPFQAGLKFFRMNPLTLRLLIRAAYRYWKEAVR